MCKGKGTGKGVPVPSCHYESMTEQTNTSRSTNKSHGKLTGVNLVFYQCCSNGQYPQGIRFPSYFVYLLYIICAVQRDKNKTYIFFAWTIMHRQRISKLYAICT